MGRNSYMLPKIRRAFEHGLQLLTAALASTRVPSYLSYFIRPDDPLLMDRLAPDFSEDRSNSEALK